MPAKDRSEEYLNSMLPIMGTNSYGNQGAERARIRSRPAKHPYGCAAWPRVDLRPRRSWVTIPDPLPSIGTRTRGSPSWPTAHRNAEYVCAEVQA